MVLFGDFLGCVTGATERPTLGGDMIGTSLLRGLARGSRSSSFSGRLNW